MFYKQNASCTVTVLGGPNWGWAYEYLCQVQKSEDEPNFSRWNGEVGKKQCSWLGNDVYDEVEIRFPPGRKWHEFFETLQECQWVAWHVEVKGRVSGDYMEESSSYRA